MDEGSLRLLFLALSKQKYVLLRSGEINDLPKDYDEQEEILSKYNGKLFINLV